MATFQQEKKEKRTVWGETLTLAIFFNFVLTFLTGTASEDFFNMK